MDAAAIIGIATQTMIIAAKLAAPVLITSLVVGLAVSVLQSITQVQEVTLAFVPKAIAVALALLFSGQWMISELVSFTQTLFAGIPGLLD